jgi:hypothetical protein
MAKQIITTVGATEGFISMEKLTSMTVGNISTSDKKEYIRHLERVTEV